MKCAAFPLFLHKKINSLFLSQDSASKVSQQQCFLPSQNCCAWNVFCSFLLKEKSLKKKRTKDWYWQKVFFPQCIGTFTYPYIFKAHQNIFPLLRKTSPWTFGLSRRKHMVEGACILWKEKATEPENNSKMCTGLQQLNLKAAEKLLGCYEQKVWFQSIILVIHYVLCKRLWGLGLISIISLHCK